jgi:hypothetical protein
VAGRAGAIARPYLEHPTTSQTLRQSLRRLKPSPLLETLPERLQLARLQAGRTLSSPIRLPYVVWPRVQPVLLQAPGGVALTHRDQ